MKVLASEPHKVMRGGPGGRSSALFFVAESPLLTYLSMTTLVVLDFLADILCMTIVTLMRTG